MASTVTSFELGFSNSALRIPYALANLSCGHFGSVAIRETVGECTKCGKVQEVGKRCECGGFSYKNLDMPHAHDEADRLTKVGDVVECAACVNEVEALETIKTVDPSSVHHSRFDPRFSPGSYHFYRFDPSSPSGFFLAFSVPASKAVDAAIRKYLPGNLSPLSPTERA